MRRALISASLACAVMLATAPGGLATSQVSRAVYVAPVARNGHPLASDVVTETVTGSCEPGSDVVTGPVYRCAANPGPANHQGGIADPCMAADYGTVPTRTVLCMLEPWSHRVIRIVTKRLPKSPGPFVLRRGFPFGVGLTDGQDCLAAQGAHDEYRGRTVEYYCSAHPAVVLLGGMHRARQPWTFDSAAATSSGYRMAAPATVAVAWFEGWPPAKR